MVVKSLEGLEDIPSWVVAHRSASGPCKETRYITFIVFFLYCLTLLAHTLFDFHQGGAASTPDTFRGYLNEGGLYAERIGAHLPGYPDTNWQEGSPLEGVKGVGINFYRTTFNLVGLIFSRSLYDRHRCYTHGVTRIYPMDSTSRFVCP